MRRLGGQYAVGAAPLGVVHEGLGPESQPGLLEGPFEQASVELANHFLGDCAGLPENAVLGQDLIVIGDGVVGSKRRQLPKHRPGRIRLLNNKRRSVSSACLPGGLDSLTALALKALGQEAGKLCEPANRIAQLDLLTGQPIEFGGLAALPSALPDRKITEGNQALEVPVGNGPMYPHRFGDIVHRPFRLVHKEVKQDPSASRIL
jgi:hypothetical protein